MAEVTDDIDGALAAYLRQALQLGFDWRTRNCQVFVADWILQRRGIDPGRDLRGRMASPRGMRRVMRQQGYADLADGTARRMADAGIREIAAADAMPGDVGIVMGIGLAGRLQQTLAIRARHGWAVLAPRGLVIARVEALRAWSVRNA